MKTKFEHMGTNVIYSWNLNYSCFVFAQPWSILANHNRQVYAHWLIKILLNMRWNSQGSHYTKVIEPHALIFSQPNPKWVQSILISKNS